MKRQIFQPNGDDREPAIKKQKIEEINADNDEARYTWLKEQLQMDGYLKVRCNRPQTSDKIIKLTSVVRGFKECTWQYEDKEFKSPKKVLEYVLKASDVIYTPSKLKTWTELQIYIRPKLTDECVWISLERAIPKNSRKSNAGKKKETLEMISPSKGEDGTKTVLYRSKRSKSIDAQKVDLISFIMGIKDIGNGIEIRSSDCNTSDSGQAPVAQ